ncbi:MAG: V4R domain-containing protein [Gemmatimonadota bacterium]
MTSAAHLVSQHCLVLSRRSLQQLRVSLERDAGLQAAAYLQEAGFAGGEEVFNGFSAWLSAKYGIDRPGNLDARHLGETLTAFFRDSGWGTLSVSSLAPSILALDSPDWSEADPAGGAQYPSCHLTSGLLADFLGRLSGSLVGVMEVECASRGDRRCRFLAGAPETLQSLYERMSQGIGYQQALGMRAVG